LACPHGRRPEVMIDPEVEEGIHQFLRETRQVLV